ncbi:MAG: flagellar hook assembly protein FlgD [Macromonas sp.]
MFMTPLSATEIQTYNANGGKKAADSDPQAMQDRFLKLLVEQLKNQDPMNPMENAEMTSQMAQINTVTGIQQLNSTMTNITSQLNALQNMQGTSLVGRQVLLPGNQLAFDANGVGQGALELPKDAKGVKVEVISTTGTVLDTLNLGDKTAGTHHFNWDAQAAGVTDLSKVKSFRVTSDVNGIATAVTALAPQTVSAVSFADGAMRLRTTSGSTVAYSDVKEFM